MKRYMSLILALLLVVGTLAVPTLAAGEDYTFTLQVNGKASDTVMVGDTVTVSLQLRSNKAEQLNLFAMQDYINFDPDYLEFRPGSEKFYEKNGYALISGSVLPGGRQVLTNRFGTNPLKMENGTILIQFDLRARKPGTVAITSTNAGVSGRNAEPFTVGTVDASVTISRGHTHSMQQVPEKPATEQAAGQKAHWVCSGCGRMFLDQAGKREVTEADLLIPQLNHVHKMKYNRGKDATETLLGLKPHWHCTACGKNFLDKAGTQEVLEEDLVIPMTEHVHVMEQIPEIPATEWTEGQKAHWFCTVCGKTYLDEAGNEEIAKEDLILPVLEKEEEADVPGKPVGFTDVASNAYYAKAVQWAVNRGITQGSSATTFSPDAPCTRAQAVTFLWRAAGSPDPTRTDCPFTDVPGNAYYRKAVLWALETGVTQGSSATTFSPDATCTRGQIVTFLWRAKGAQAASGSLPFTDVSHKDWYAKAVLWAVQNQVTAGITATQFAPGASCTRGQIVTFLYRAD